MATPGPLLYWCVFDLTTYTHTHTHTRIHAHIRTLLPSITTLLSRMACMGWRSRQLLSGFVWLYVIIERRSWRRCARECSRGMARNCPRSVLCAFWYVFLKVGHCVSPLKCNYNFWITTKIWSYFHFKKEFTSFTPFVSLSWENDYPLYPFLCGGLFIINNQRLFFVDFRRRGEDVWLAAHTHTAYALSVYKYGCCTPITHAHA